MCYLCFEFYTYYIYYILDQSFIHDDNDYCYVNKTPGNFPHLIFSHYPYYPMMLHIAMHGNHRVIFLPIICIWVQKN